MKNQFKKLILLMLMTSVALTGGVGSVFAQEAASNANPQAYEAQQIKEDAKYSKKVMKAVRVGLGVDEKFTQADGVIETMPKVEVMNYYLASFGKKVKGQEVRLAVEEIFDIDLNYVSKMDYGSKLAIYPPAVMESLRVSLNEEPKSTMQDARIMDMTKNQVMDRYIKERDYSLTGEESRTLINQIFGVNLSGISNLEYMQIAVSSKGQWIVKSDSDLFVLESSLDDVDVSIYTTPYFKSVTGSEGLPESLKNKLVNIGFTYDEEANLLYYKNPTGESVPDAFKGQVMGILIGTIMTEYKNRY
ncbi:uncharacterized protein YceK [Planomicrobium stackebrandtii]|uniref:Uncharacterized protein YceK n=1 Tax=Planomicrobium stackebrandtii TaxID=253160 RepID=A0ABU0GVC6_9BACL|nr:hypothetical protein [Planomicrobium stackebrandtii]MDQ0428512.1 uncharacterized protein YceK [Planomicrobium stackebrandtii]